MAMNYGARFLLALNIFSSIDFGQNNIRTGSGTVISDFLARNPPLGHPSILMMMILLITHALKRNTNLHDITNKGHDAIWGIEFSYIQNKTCT